MDRETRLSEIATDNRSGSQAITRAAAEFILGLLEESPSMPAADLRTRLLQIGERLLQAHPTMASLFHLFDRLLQALERTPKPQFLSGGARAAARDFIAEMETRNQHIADHLFKLIHRMKGPPVVLTHSASGSVSAALSRCWERGKRFSILCTESRPVCEGTGQAVGLARAGIPTSLATDALASSLLGGASRVGPRPDLVVVGADAVSAAGAVNKSGTFGLAVIARRRGVPCYVLAGSEKFLPPSYPIESVIAKGQEPTEILSPIPDGLRVVNGYFDLTPLEDLTCIISEAGLFPPEDLRKHINALKLHSELLSRAISKASRDRLPPATA